MYDDRRLENDNMIFHRSRNFISFLYIRAICLLKLNVGVDCHEMVTKIMLVTYICCCPRVAIKPLKNTGIMKDIVFEACSVLFGSFIHPGIIFR